LSDQSIIPLRYRRTSHRAYTVQTPCCDTAYQTLANHVNHSLHYLYSSCKHRINNPLANLNPTHCMDIMQSTIFLSFTALHVYQANCPSLYSTSHIPKISQLTNQTCHIPENVTDNYYCLKQAWKKKSIFPFNLPFLLALNVSYWCWTPSRSIAKS